jgi:membrane-bound lytic murein transglycosylase F
MTNEFDGLIKSAADIWLEIRDWRLLKSQLLQESQLNPTAVSNRGAEGIAQFMPGTWADVKRMMHLPDNASPRDPNFAISAAAYYMNYLWGKWTSPRPPMDRYALALASYNAGLGNILKAQKEAGGALDYKSIIAALPKVTGRANAKETTDYVRRIFGYWLGMITG